MTVSLFANFMSSKKTIIHVITKTCPCNVYPFISHLNIAKLFFFLFLLQNIDCGYSLEPSRQDVYPQSMYIFPVKSFIFYNFKNLCMLHGYVFVMIRIKTVTDLVTGHCPKPISLRYFVL